MVESAFHLVALSVNPAGIDHYIKRTLQSLRLLSNSLFTVVV